MRQGKQDRQSTPRWADAGGFLIGPAFLLLAGWFVLGSATPTIPAAATPVVMPEQIDPSPLRVPMGDPPVSHIAGFEMRCNHCHIHKQGNLRDRDYPLRQHEETVLSHGIDAGCLACHARSDREKLELRDGSLIVFAQAAQLCAECHGPVTRDWELGAHGKTLGFWDPDLGTPRKLTCTECHDPHSPSFAPIMPLPGPNTLRMGERRSQEPDEGVHPASPLRRWLGGEPNHETSTDQHD